VSSGLRGIAVLLFACAGAACSASGGSPNACPSSTAQPLGIDLCPGGPTVQGVDVSVYQGTVDWAVVHANGIDFAFARVSDGTGVPDTEFANNWPAMKAAGVVRGAYQFFRPEEDPAAQADLFVSMLSKAGGIAPGDLPPVLDLEVTGSTSDATIQANMETWFAAMKAATGMQPMLYMSPSFASHAGTGFGSNPLWVANWGVPCPAVPAGWSTWAFWQTSDTGMVKGIPSAVDLDEFNGSLSQLPVLGGSSDGGSGGPDAATHDAGPGGPDAAADGGAPPPRDAGAVADAGSRYDAGSGMQGGSAGSTGPCR
jgi:lysozyme